MRMLEDTRGPFLISTDPGRLDATAIHAFLSRSYWAEAIPLEVVVRGLAGSLDQAAFAYLCDVYVLDTHRVGGWGAG